MASCRLTSWTPPSTASPAPTTSAWRSPRRRPALDARRARHEAHSPFPPYRTGAPDGPPGGEGGNDRGPVPDDRPRPPCMAMLPAAVVLTVVAVAASWLGMTRRQFARA